MKTYVTKFRILIAIFLVSIGIILWYGQFKKWIDIAGGVELTYEIDLSKYRAIYKNDSEFLAASNTAKKIIQTNIAKRVNALGVGDAEIKTQKIGSRDYIVISIGGITDIQAAKSIIGKTVELEFKLPNTNSGSNEERMQRLTVADEILSSVGSGATSFVDYGSGRMSEDVYYDRLTGLTLAQLPAVYSQILNLSSYEGKVIPQVLSGVLIAPGMSGETQSIPGLFITKINSITQQSMSGLNDQEIFAQAKIFGAEVTDLFSKIAWSDLTGTRLSPFMYHRASQLIVDGWSIFDNQEAYQMTIYVVNSGDQSDISSLVALLKSQKTPPTSTAYQKVIEKQWVDTPKLTFLSALSGIQQWVVTIPGSGYTLVANFLDHKSSTERIYRKITLDGLSLPRATEFVTAISSVSVYDIEQIFVKESMSWRDAISPKSQKILNGAYFKYASVDQSQLGQPVVNITFNDEWKELFCDLTEANIKKQMAIFVGGKLVTNPTINSKICGGTAQIEGSYTTATAKELADSLNEWALPAKLILSNESTLSPTLGEHARQWALWAAGVGLILILILMIVMYGLRYALIGLASLVLFLVILMAFIKLFGYALSLSWIAAIILNIGMGIDASILVFERIREEVASGKPIKQAISIGYERSREPIRDGQMCTLAIGLLLLLLWSDIFQWFGLMMCLNIILILTTTVPMIRELLNRFAVKK